MWYQGFWDDIAKALLLLRRDDGKEACQKLRDVIYGRPIAVRLTESKNVYTSSDRQQIWNEEIVWLF